jgi:outer membrane protein assembly factor BamB
MRHLPPLLLALLLSALCLHPRALANDDWPQFRGPGGQGISDSTGLPTTWNDSQNVKWKTAIHDKGWSSPVVLGNQVWLTTAREDGTELFAICFDRETGKIIHDLKLFMDPAPNQVFKQYNSYASPTPVLEPGRAYVTFGSAGTACLDSATGQKIWERNDIKINHWRGAGSSPFVDGNLLYLNFDGADDQFIIALDKNTGQNAWRKQRSVDYKDLDPATGKPKAEGDFRKAFSTCRIIEVGGRRMLISAGAKAVYAYDPASGDEIWRLDLPEWHSAAATPVFGQGLIFLAPGFSRAALLAIDPKGSGALSNDHIVWKLYKNAPNKPSPILVGDLLYLVDDKGIASCLEAKTGKEVWSKRIEGNFSSAPIAGDGKVYFCSEGGVTTVIAAGREFKKLAENKLTNTGRVMASPAAAGRSIFIRGEKFLYRVEE